MDGTQSVDIGSDRFNEFKYSWNNFYIIVPLIMFLLVIFLGMQVDYSFIYEIDYNLYSSGSLYLLLWNYYGGDYDYPGDFTFNDFKMFMNNNLMLVSALLFLIVFISVIFFFLIQSNSRIPFKRAYIYESSQNRSLLVKKSFLGLLVIVGSSFLIWYIIFDATNKASSINNFVDYQASTPAEAISDYDYGIFLEIYDFSQSIFMYNIFYSLIVFTGLIVELYYGFQAINRTRGILVLENDYIIFPAFTLSKDSSGNKQTIKKWAPIPIDSVNDLKIGTSTEYYSGKKVIGSYYSGNTRYTQYSESSYSRSVNWLIVETYDLGNFAIPIIFNTLGKRTSSNESVGKIFLEKFNHIGLSSQALGSFLQALENSTNQSSLSKKIIQLQQIFFQVKTSQLV